MRHRFFLEDDLIKVGWGDEGSLTEWDAILQWIVRTLDHAPAPLHILMDFSLLYVITEEVFPSEIASQLAHHSQAEQVLLVSRNPVFVHFVNQHWITQSEQAVGIRAFLGVSDALSWLRNRPL